MLRFPLPTSFYIKYLKAGSGHVRKLPGEEVEAKGLQINFKNWFQFVSVICLSSVFPHVFPSPMSK